MPPKNRYFHGYAAGVGEGYQIILPDYCDGSGALVSWPSIQSIVLPPLRDFAAFAENSPEVSRIMLV
jgi:hypothetical protein